MPGGGQARVLPSGLPEEGLARGAPAGSEGHARVPSAGQARMSAGVSELPAMSGMSRSEVSRPGLSGPELPSSKLSVPGVSVPVVSAPGVAVSGASAPRVPTSEGAVPGGPLSDGPTSGVLMSGMLMSQVPLSEGPTSNSSMPKVPFSEVSVSELSVPGGAPVPGAGALVPTPRRQESMKGESTGEESPAPIERLTGASRPLFVAMADTDASPGLSPYDAWSKAREAQTPIPARLGASGGASAAAGAGRSAGPEAEGAGARGNADERKEAAVAPVPPFDGSKNGGLSIERKASDVGRARGEEALLAGEVAAEKIPGVDKSAVSSSAVSEAGAAGDAAQPGTILWVPPYGDDDDEPFVPQESE